MDWAFGIKPTRHLCVITNISATLNIGYISRVRELGWGGEFGDKSMVYRSPINITDKKRYTHPTIKPVPMLEKFLNVHTNSDDLVFDPFMGSGSTGVACLNSGRRFIGIEIDETYFQTASKRLSDYEIGNPA